MKYKVELTVKAHLIIEATSEVEARGQVEEGYSMSSLYFDDDEIDEVSEV